MAARLPPGWIPPVAARQSGLFTAAQAIAAGATPAQVRRRRETGRWVLVVGDALALTEVHVTPWLLAQGVALTWPDAVVALASAAAVHRLPVPPPDGVHVILPRRLQHRDGLVTHRLRLERRDVVQVGRGRVTSLQRTLFDCIGRLPTRDSERLVAWSATRDLFSREALAEAVAARPSWWGNAARRAALDDLAHGSLSAAERRLHRILRSAGLTGWQADAKVWDREGLIGRADVLFAEVGLVVEVDGFEHHAVSEFQRDRTKQNRLVLAGYTVLRFTWADLVDRPRMVVDRIRSMLAHLAGR